MNRISHEKYLQALELRERMRSIRSVAKKLDVPYVTLWNYMTFGEPKKPLHEWDEETLKAIEACYCIKGVTFVKLAAELGITYKEMQNRVKSCRLRFPEKIREIERKAAYRPKICKGCVFVEKDKNPGHYICKRHHRRTTLKQSACKYKLDAGRGTS